VSTGGKQPKSKNSADGSTSEHNKRHYIRMILRGCIRTFFCWLAASIKNPDNLPAYLTALFTFSLAVFAYAAWDEATRGTKAMQGQLQVMDAARRPWVVPDFSETKITKPLTFDKEGATLRFVMPAKNGGSSIALGTHIETVFNISPLPFPAAGPVQKFRDEAIRAMGGMCNPQSVLTMGFVQGRIALPGDQFPLEPTDESTTVKRQQFKFNPAGGDISAWLPFCIGYIDDVGRPHGTGVILIYHAQAGPNHFPADGEIPGYLSAMPASWIVY